MERGWSDLSGNCRKPRHAQRQCHVPPICGACGLLQDGISIHRPGEYPSDAIRKYDRQKHKLLYDAAFIYYYYLKDVSKAERYLTAYLKTRPKNSKDKVQEVDADGVPIIGEDNRYNAAENWLKDIREKRKKEDFFKGKVDTASVTPIK